jgi:hypothetical protein
MGFLWEGSTGARAVQLLREQPPGTVMLTPDLAQALGAKRTLLHQLLANAVSLRLIKKVRMEGSAFSGWKLGAGNDSANIEPKSPQRPRRSQSPAQIERAKTAAQRRQDREAKRLRPMAQEDGISGRAVASLVEAAPAWLRGSVGRIHDVAPKPSQAGAYSRGQRATYLDVVHRDGTSLFRGVVRVQAVLPEFVAIEAWSEAHGRVVRLHCAGFIRVTDERSGFPVDLQAWLKDPTANPPLVKPPRVKRRRAGPLRLVDVAAAAADADPVRRARLADLKRKKLLTEREAATYIGLEVSAFRELFRATPLPTSVSPLSGERRWRRAELAKLLSVGQEPTSVARSAA